MQNSTGIVPPSNSADKKRLDALTELVEMLNTEVTYLRNQNSQSQVAQREIQFNYDQSNRGMMQAQGKKIDREQHLDRDHGR